MKKVLFIDYHFPPLIGGWRAIGSFVKYLPEFGWQAVVLSAAESVDYGKDYSLLREVPADIEIHRVGHRGPPKLWQYARHKLRINLDFPDQYKKWYNPALRKARAFLQDKRVDVIFSTAPPYTTHFVARQLKKEFGIPWVARWADPWSGNTLLELAYEKTLIKPLWILQRSRIRRAESDLLKLADRTFVVSWYHQRQMRELYGLEENTIGVINNGYDEFDFKGLKPRSLYPDRLTIIFLGTFYSQFQEPFLRFMEAVNEVAEDAEIVLIGRGGEALRGNNLTRILYVPKEKALAFCAGSDFLLVIMPPVAKWIPMKTYDYLRLGKPILALVPEDGDTARIVRESKAGFILSFDQQQMKEQLRTIFDEWGRGELKGFQPDQEYISRFERRKVTERIVQIFKEVSP